MKESEITRELIEGVKKESGSAFQNCRDCTYGIHNTDVIARLKILAELEDKIEQGYIRILPVKEGDKIYVVPSKVNFVLNRINRYHEHNRVYEQTVDEIRFFGNDVYMVYSCDFQQNHHCEFFGKTWFLTREEAEKRLKELQGGNE